LPAREHLLAFAARIDGSLAALATNLRDATPPRITNLREEERTLATQLAKDAGDDTSGAAAAIIEALDRMTDSIDTLAHILMQPDQPDTARQDRR
ncbi:MAG: hypothetical protein ACHP7D_07110, partial [Lysobacterales bacterium]